jgi:hypothetical protein
MKFLATIVAFALLEVPALACAGCREPGEEVEATTVLAGFGFSWGVIVMLVFLFTLCSGLGWFVVNTVKTVDANHGAGQ